MLLNASRRNSLVPVILAVLFLRLVAGFHFFHEGATKLRSGEFSAAPFLEQARGPLVPFYHSLLDDPRGFHRLGVSPASPLELQPKRTLALWEHFRDRAVVELGLDERKETRARLAYDRFAREWNQFVDMNQVAIDGWLAGDERLDGFAQDGPLREKTARQVASLRDQAASIAARRRETAAPWFARIDALWDNYEAAINELGDGSRRVELDRPWAPGNSRLAWINRWLPWFDIVVGVLLVAGLATRTAAIAGGLLLVGVVAAQPFWLPDAIGTFPQWIELAALLVLAALGAGRIGGLDYFFTRSRYMVRTPEAERT